MHYRWYPSYHIMRPTTPQERATLAHHFLGRTGDYTAFFEVYDDLAQKGDDGVGTIDCETPYNTSSRRQTYLDVIRASSTIKQRTQTTKAEILESLQHGNDNSPSDVRNVVHLAVQAMTMVDAGGMDWHSTGFMLGGSRPTSWPRNESFQSFMERSFPRSLETSAEKVRNALEHKASMKAWKLQDRAGVRFRRTNNLADHLLFDARRNCLYLFHQVAFLKANLERYRNEARPLSIAMPESLRQ